MSMSPSLQGCSASSSSRFTQTRRQSSSQESSGEVISTRMKFPPASSRQRTREKPPALMLSQARQSPSGERFMALAGSQSESGEPLPIRMTLKRALSSNGRRLAARRSLFRLNHGIAINIMYLKRYIKQYRLRDPFRARLPFELALRRFTLPKLGFRLTLMPMFLAAIVMAVLFLGLPGPGLAQLDPENDLGATEEQIIKQVRLGRLSQDELLRKGEEISYFTRLKYYLYAKELEPYFEGLEDALRDLARTGPEDAAGLAEKNREAARVMALVRKRLFAAGRGEPEKDWRRGLTGLIWLDQDWRRRIKEQGKDEIKNPYDLIRYLDCLDAGIRGLDKRPPTDCPARAGAESPAP